VLGVADNTADYRWDFGDGTSASGKIVSHVYTGPGNYDVKLTVVLGNGTTRTADADVGVHGEVLVAFNDTTGAFQSYLLGETRTLTPLAAVEDGALQIERTGTAASIPRWVLKDLRGSDDFDINFTVKGDAPGGSGEIFRQHGSFLATMTSAGQLSFQVFTNDGLTNKLLTTGLALNDGQAHDIQLQFRDGDVQIWTDGVLNVQRTMTGSLATTLESDIVFGNPWGKANFVSDISAFEVRAHVGDYADTPMTTVLVDDNVQGTGMHDDGWTGRVFDFASFAGSSKYLLDNARVEVDSDGDDQVVLDGDKDYVNLGRQVAYEKSDRVGFSVDFARDEADGSVDRLIWNHMKVGLTLQGDGVSVQVATKDQGFKSYAASNIGLNDTDRHRAEVMVDTVDDRVQVVVDGEVVIDVEDADFELEGAGGREAGWMIGTPWNRYFDGTVYDFRLGESYQFIEDMDEPEAMPGQVLN
jgi:PKD repeat protein